MMTITRIERLLAAGSHRRLVRSILANGRCEVEALITRLCRGDDGETAALGLALQRCSELSYGPCPLATEIAERLLAHRRPNGLFGPAGESSLAATAVALRGLLEFRDLQLDAAPEFDAALRLGLDALGAHCMAGPFPGDTLDAAVIVGWLGRVPGIEQAIDLARLDEMLGPETDAPRHEIGDLVRYARAAAA